MRSQTVIYVAGLTERQLSEVFDLAVSSSNPPADEAATHILSIENLWEKYAITGTSNRINTRSGGSKANEFLVELGYE